MFTYVNIKSSSCGNLNENTMKTIQTQAKKQKGVKMLALKFNRSEGHISRILKGERPAAPIKGLPQAIQQLKKGEQNK